MAVYTVIEPFVVARDGAVLHYTKREVGSQVELSDDEAESLLSSGAVAFPDDAADSDVVAPQDDADDGDVVAIELEDDAP